jgi:hypothetical protein
MTPSCRTWAKVRLSAPLSSPRSTLQLNPTVCEQTAAPSTQVLEVTLPTRHEELEAQATSEEDAIRFLRDLESAALKRGTASALN